MHVCNVLPLVPFKIRNHMPVAWHILFEPVEVARRAPARLHFLLASICNMVGLAAHGDMLTRVMFNILQDLGRDGYRPISADAVLMLKAAARDLMVDIFRQASEIAHQRKSNVVLPKDFRLACSGIVSSSTSSSPTDKEVQHKQSKKARSHLPAIAHQCLPDLPDEPPHVKRRRLNYTVDQSTTTTLRIKRKWFDLIASGSKTVEFRRASPYWMKAVMNRPRLRHLRFVNGYAKTSPFLACAFKGAEMMQTKALPADLAPPPGTADFVEMFQDAEEVTSIRLGEIVETSSVSDAARTCGA
jgi:histone H3/H4